MPSIVVALRWAGPASAPASVVAAGVRAAIDRASVGGAHLIGIGADGGSFSFDDDAIEEAIDLALAYVSPDEGPQRWKVGVGLGELASVRDQEGFERLSVGPAAGRASALARVAREGEVMVDLAIPQASAGSLIGLGRRVATLASGRFRGMVLDCVEPWRRDGGESIARVRSPRIVGREASLGDVRAVQAGGLAIVRAPSGNGGTRFLEELAARTPRTLLVVPAGSSVEPLGALRLAILRELDREHHGKSIPPMTTRTSETERRLRDGVGADIDAVAEIIAERLTSKIDESETPLVLIDDAMLVDRATLEAIGLAASAPGAPFAVVARLDTGDTIPTPLSSLIVEAEVVLKALQPHEASEALEDACGGAGSLAAEVKKRWVRRGGGIPLAIVESLRHGFGVGELAIRNGVIAPRAKASGRGRTLSPHAWITRRLAALAIDRPHDLTVATVVALAGAGTTRERLEEIAADLGVPSGVDLDAILARLVREGLLSVVAGKLEPSSRSMSEAASERCDEATRRRLHGAIAAAFARTATGLDLAEGAHHAALAGDHLGAAALGMRAADRAKKAGLSQWAEALASFARAQGAPPGTPLATTPSPPPRNSEHAAPTMRSPAPPRPTHDEDDDVEPVEIEFDNDAAPSTLRTPPPDSRAAPSSTRGEPRPIALAMSLNTAEIEQLPAPFPIPPAHRPEPIDVAIREIASPGAPMIAAPPIDRSILGAPSELAAHARKALIARDLVSLDASLSKLELAGGSLTAIARIRGIAALARGDLPNGLRLIRVARAGSKTQGETARASLAYAIALGVAGLRDDALLEALAALAVERDRAAHGRGDTACRKVIEQLMIA